MKETSDKSLVIDVYLAPRDNRTASIVNANSVARKIRYGYFQTSNFELSEDTLSITSSKIYTYEDLSDYQKGDFVACYLPNPAVETFGIFGLQHKVPYFVGVIDSVEIVTKLGSPNILNLKEVLSVFDNDIMVSKFSGTSWENHVRTVAANNFFTYDRYVDLQSLVNPPSLASSWGHAYQLAGISMHRGTGTSWRYDPTEAWTPTSFYKYLVNGTKKYNVFYRIRGIQWNLPQKYPNEPTKDIYPKASDEFGLEQFNLIDIDIVKTDDGDAASFHIKDNTDDLFDWEFTTTVGSSECNAVRVLSVDADGNSKTINTVKDGQNVPSTQAILNAESRGFPYTSKGSPVNVSSGVLNNNVDGLYYFITTRGEVIGNGVQMEDSKGNKRWGSAFDGFAGQLLFDVPDNEPDKIGTGSADNMLWYHRFDKYVQMPIKMKQVTIKKEDLPSGLDGGDRPTYLAAARDALSAAAYAHQFKIKIKMDSELIDWRELWLGRSVYVTYKGVLYKSLVTGRQLKSGTNYITLILGHNRHKLGALLQEKLT